MTNTDRNPDIRLDTEAIPPGMTIIEGKFLPQTARRERIPFGVATRTQGTGQNQRQETIGLIIRDEHAKRFKAALRKRDERQAARKKQNAFTEAVKS